MRRILSSTPAHRFFEGHDEETPLVRLSFRCSNNEANDKRSVDETACEEARLKTTTPSYSRGVLRAAGGRIGEYGNQDC